MFLQEKRIYGVLLHLGCIFALMVYFFVFRMYICIYGVFFFIQGVFLSSVSSKPAARRQDHPHFGGLAQPGASSAPPCHISSPGQALDKASHPQEINPAGCRPVTSRAGGQERLPALPEVLMRLEIKSWTGGVPLPRRALAGTPVMAPAWQTHPRCPPRGRRAESERRGRKSPPGQTVFFTKYTNFKSVTIIYKTRELQNVRNCPVCTRIEKCRVLEQAPARQAAGPRRVSLPVPNPSPDILCPGASLPTLLWLQGSC